MVKGGKDRTHWSLKKVKMCYWLWYGAYMVHIIFYMIFSIDFTRKKSFRSILLQILDFGCHKCVQYFKITYWLVLFGDHFRPKWPILTIFLSKWPISAFSIAHAMARFTCWETKTEYLDDERKYGRDSGGFERFIGSIPTGGPSKHQSSIKPIKEWIIY